MTNSFPPMGSISLSRLLTILASSIYTEKLTLNRYGESIRDYSAKSIHPLLRRKWSHNRIALYEMIGHFGFNKDFSVYLSTSPSLFQFSHLFKSTITERAALLRRWFATLPYVWRDRSRYGAACCSIARSRLREARKLPLLSSHALD